MGALEDLQAGVTALVAEDGVVLSVVADLAAKAGASADGTVSAADVQTASDAIKAEVAKVQAALVAADPTVAVPAPVEPAPVDTVPADTTTPAVAEPVNLVEALRCGIYCVASCVSVGGLIQAVPGSFGGSGGFRTNRSGWAA